MSGLQGVFKKRDAGEESFGAGCAQLMLELLVRVGSAGGGDNTRETMDGVSERDVVDLVDGLSAYFSGQTDKHAHAPCSESTMRRRDPTRYLREG